MTFRLRRAIEAARRKLTVRLLRDQVERARELIEYCDCGDCARWHAGFESAAEKAIECIHDAEISLANARGFC